MFNSATRAIALLASVAAFAVLAAPAHADGEVNIYSSRHYDTDARLYSDFTEATRHQGQPDRGQGRRADRADEGRKAPTARPTCSSPPMPAGCGAPIRWACCRRVGSPKWSRGAHPPGKPASSRRPLVRAFPSAPAVIFYDKEKVSEPPADLRSAGRPENTRAWSAPATGSPTSTCCRCWGAYVANNGDEAAKQWVQGPSKDNLAREPQGGDTDQLKGIVSGECSIAVANTYYFARGVAGQVDGLTEGVDRIGHRVSRPGRQRHGHVNILRRRHRREFAQPRQCGETASSTSPPTRHSPTSPTATTSIRSSENVAASSVVEGLGDFTADTLNLNELGKNQARAQEIYKSRSVYK